MKIAQTSHKVAGILGAATALLTTINLAAFKYNPNAPFYPNKIAMTMSRVIGPELTAKILNLGSSPGLPPQGVNPWGWANSTTGTGAVFLILDYAIHKIGIRIPYYSYASPFIKAVGGGLVGGGVIGGILDPEVTAGGPTRNPGSINGTSSTQLLASTWGGQ